MAVGTVLDLKLPDFLTRWPHGEIVLKGRRVELFHVLDRLDAGDSQSQVAEVYELDSEQVRRVVEFAHQYPAEISLYMQDYRAELARQEAQSEPGTGYLRIRRMMESPSTGSKDKGS